MAKMWCHGATYSEHDLGRDSAGWCDHATYNVANFFLVDFSQIISRDRLRPNYGAESERAPTSIFTDNSKEVQQRGVNKNESEKTEKKELEDETSF